MKILAEISAGELIDKITILEIKLANIQDQAKRANIARELEALLAALPSDVAGNARLAELRAELKGINEELWRIEDDIRDLERARDFGPAFIALARSVYRTNDRRADVKRLINSLTNSEIVEEKSYQAY